MEFKHKSPAEVDKMTADEREQYAKDKQAYEEQRFKSIEKNLETQKSSLETKLAEMQNSTVKQEEIDTIKEELKNINISIESLGKSNSRQTEMRKNVFFEKLKENNLAEDGTFKRLSTDEKNIEIKAFDSENIHSVNNIINTNFPTPGTTAINSVYAQLRTQVLGVTTSPRPYSPIMNYVDVIPLRAYSLTSFEQKIYGGFEVTGECEIKPYIRTNFDAQTTEAEAVNALWCTTLKMREFFPEVEQLARTTFEDLLNEKIPSTVLEVVKTNGVGFTPLPGMAQNTAPDNFEAIVKVCASLKKQGYMPNVVLISNVAYANMISELGTDGHYKLQNGQSVQLVDNRLKIGSTFLELIEDPELGDDEFIVADLNSVKVGLRESVIYQETDGRVDGETVVKTGMGVNIRTHELVTFVATQIPSSYASGIVSETFTNVKTLITLI